MERNGEGKYKVQGKVKVNMTWNNKKKFKLNYKLNYKLFKIRTCRWDFHSYLPCNLHQVHRGMDRMDLVSRYIFGYHIHIPIGSLDPSHIQDHIQLWYLA